MTVSSSPVLEAVLARRSRSKVTPEAPGHDEIAAFVSAASRLADHSSLRPWRVIAIRGAARDRVGRSFAVASGAKKDPRKYIEKTHRASLLLAVVVSVKKSKVPAWEQEAVASGVAHLLSLLLDEAGWGVFWRTGSYTRDKAVRKAHRLEKGEELLGWLYVGRPDGKIGGPKRPAPAERHLSILEP
ncbi:MULTISPECIES: nitroreductase family protein [unclassified Rathayibacter]|uniref:nitroreductase family protein n=1 Tax=unclassified Rathayibacter TaxID=2609250 RepID=UPI000CE7CD1D|nr:MULTISPECIES: nitroreductase family protein [unclassified Rathayibacter]PPF44690.1 nitroreductase [Rathayibacter sp. AY1A1]PPG87058.1 nitroreductase [Rathayibacter sp. AY1H2]PPH00328.1 nitroreductase [Rathayibacter sp. AY1G9]